MNFDYLAEALPQSPPPAHSSTLCFSNLEPWMDEEYAKRLCALMGWEGVSVKIPQPAPDPATGHTVNNPGYCFLSFASPAHAANALAQVMPANPATQPAIMPNSSRPYSVSWANAAAMPSMYSQAPFLHPAGTLPPPQPKEYSIFVGDLAPEASNSDLVAVFRNPMLGLRSDREPKFIRPFYSCKSAKIQLDPVTGLSKGYGFVRFTDQAEQQRALIEMHGLYCLSRPMRISPATAKSKAPPYPASGPNPTAYDEHASAPHQQGKEQKPVSTGYDPHAQTVSHASHAPSLNQRGSIDISPTIMEQIASLAAQPSGVSHDPATNGANGDTHASITAPLAVRRNGANNAAFFTPPQGYPTTPSLESPPNTGFEDPQTQAWRQQQAQTHALLGTLMGPNGEQITSADPYNTTVFVGGLSPLVPEETLRTFFAPFGEIHYVKVPVGKHCGFVQFVHKTDAERAIEKMQGFPIGGSKIRLSWGRSQYKAVQAAAAQAVAAAASVPGSSTPPSASYMPTGVPQPPPQQHASPPQPTTTVPQADLLAQIAARQGGSFTPEQTAILLQLGYGGWSNGAATGDAARRNLPGQQTRRVNGLQTVEEATPKSHHQPTSAASYFPRGMQALYPEDTHEDLDADAAGARISNSVSMSALGSVAALGQGFSTRASRANTIQNFAPFGNTQAYASGAGMISSASDGALLQRSEYLPHPSSHSFIPGFSSTQQGQGLSNGERGSPSVPSPYNAAASAGNQFSSFLDEHHAGKAPGGATFQISDILRQDSQPLPRMTRGSVSGQGQLPPSQSYTPPNAGAIGNKSSVDGLSAAMGNMGFANSDAFRRPGAASIWSHTPNQPSSSPTLARSRAAASGSPHSSAGGSGSDAA